MPIIGTSPDMIDAAEDRERFQQLLHTLGLRQPPNATARTEEEALEKAKELGYPLVVRPSYVLGGRAMEIVHEQRDLERYMREAVKVSHESPVLLDRFLNDAIECDVDATRRAPPGLAVSWSILSKQGFTAATQLAPCRHIPSHHQPLLN